MQHTTLILRVALAVEGKLNDRVSTWALAERRKHDSMKWMWLVMIEIDCQCVLDS